MMSTPTPPLGASNILVSKSREVGKVSSPSVLKDLSKPVSSVSVLKENSSTLTPGSTSRTLYITPDTPPRSPSPEIYREDPPGIFLFYVIVNFVAYSEYREADAKSLVFICR